MPSKNPTHTIWHIEQIEQHFSISLPKAFIALYVADNFDLNSTYYYHPPSHSIPLNKQQDSAIDPEHLWPIDAFYSIDKLTDLESLGEAGWALEDSFEDEIATPTKLITFAQSAGRFWCLDYRSQDHDPSVIFIYSDYDGQPLEVFLATDFAIFAAGLNQKTSEE